MPFELQWQARGRRVRDVLIAAKVQVRVSNRSYRSDTSLCSVVNRNPEVGMRHTRD
jgi:hypothetical protein